MKTLKQLGWILTIALGSTTAAYAQAVEIHNTLNVPNNSGTSPLPPGWIANQFSTGAFCPNGCELGDITLHLLAGNDVGDDTPTTGFTLVLTDDGGNQPGASILATLQNPSSFLSGSHDAIFTPQQETILDHDTFYWVKFSATSGADDIEWFISSDNSSSSSKSALDNGSGLNPFDTFPYKMKVEALPANVPVPAAFGLLGSALLGLVTCRRRKAA